MKKITRVEIENFQSHKKTEVDFANFTVILGHSDSGKSAIIRAIKWCLYNTAGTKFIRDGCTTAKVVVHFDNNTYVERIRGKKDNCYILNNNGEELRLEGFGSGPVKEVVDFHGMREVKFFGSSQSLNICDQMSPPFFLLNSSSEKATMIGSLAKTEVADKAISTTSSIIREKKIEKKLLQESESETVEELEKYEKLVFLERSLRKIDEIKNKVKKDMDLISKISDLKNEVKNSQFKVKKMQEIIDREPAIDNYILKLEEASKNKNQINLILKDSSAISETERKKSKLENILKIIDVDKADLKADELEAMLKTKSKLSSTKALNLSVEKKRLNIEKLEKEVKVLDNVDNFIADLSLNQGDLSLINKVKTRLKEARAVSNRISNGKNIIEGLNIDVNKYLDEYKSSLLDNSCPTCLRPFTKEDVESINDLT